jgi:hypothetical protein
MMCAAIAAREPAAMMMIIIICLMARLQPPSQCIHMNSAYVLIYSRY